MELARYVTDAAILRRRHVAAAVSVLFPIGLLLLVAWPFAHLLADYLTVMPVCSERYRLAQWASSTSLAALLTIAALAAMTLLTVAARTALGLPAPRRQGGMVGLVLRLLVFLAVTGSIAIRAIDEPILSLGLGLLASALLTGDRLRAHAANGFAALAIADRLRAMRPTSTDANVSLAIAGAVRAIGNGGGVTTAPIYRALTRRADGLAASAPPEIRPFLVETERGRFRVEPSPGATLVVAPETVSLEGRGVFLREGDRITALGERISAVESGAYRDDLPRVGAGAGLLALATSGASPERRLRIAGWIEIASAIALACPIALLIGAWIVFGLLARWG